MPVLFRFLCRPINYDVNVNSTKELIRVARAYANSRKSKGYSYPKPSGGYEGGYSYTTTTTTTTPEPIVRMTSEQIESEFLTPAPPPSSSFDRVARTTVIISYKFWGLLLESRFTTCICLVAPESKSKIFSYVHTTSVIHNAPICNQLHIL